MRVLALLISMAVLSDAACLAVSSARILAGDLARAIPLLGSLDPATQLGLAPLPGTERILSSGELVRMLRRQGLESGSKTVFEDVCVERAARPLSRIDLDQALVAALNLAGAAIEIIDFSRQPLPPGQLEFHREGLNFPPRAAPDTPVIWRGKLIYDQQSSAAVWAKVHILVEQHWLVAAENISAGAVIGRAQLRGATGRQFPDLAPSPFSPDSIIGKIARRNIRSGERLAPGLLQDPEDVRKGDRVQVKVSDGRACLSLDAIARSSGKKGETILIHNPSSGRNFQAVVEEKGQVTVRSDPRGAN